MSSRVIVAIRVAASTGHAFDVFTTQIGLWWQPSPLFAFTPGPAGRLAFEGQQGGRLIESGDDGSVFEIGRIVEWRPGERLVFSWRQMGFSEDQTTQVTVSFDAVETAGRVETRVTVEHRGWDTVPQAHAARHGFPNAAFQLRHAEWWQTLLDALRQLLAERG